MHRYKARALIFLRRAREFAKLIAERYWEKSCQKSAASLTYVTLFAIVPLITVTYSMFSIIPAFQDLGEDFQELIFSYMLPETGQELQVYLQEFSDQARRLTVVGVAFLVVSAYLMLANIEKNFNAIWGVLRGRRGVSNFLLYWAILSLGPLLLGAGLAMSTYVASVRLFMDDYDMLGVVSLVFTIMPWLLGVAAFTLLYAAVPNCKVPLSHALVGGIVATIGFELLKALFALIVGHSSLTLIYGAFAIVPLFLLWVNLSWTVILGGAVLVRTIGSYQIVLKERGYPNLLACLLVLWQFHKAAEAGGSLSDRELLQSGLSSEQWQLIRNALQQHRVIAATNQGDFVLARDLHRLKVSDLRVMLDIPDELPGEADHLKALPWYPEAAKRLGAIDEFVAGQLDQPLAELFSHK